MTDLSETDFRKRFLRLEEKVLPGDSPGVETLVFDSDLNIDASTSIALEEAGVHVLDTGTLNFAGDAVDVTDDGDGTATVTIAGGEDIDTQTATHTFPVTEIPDTEAAVMRVFCPAHLDMLIFRGGVQDETGAVPAGLDLRVYNETDATEIRVVASKYANSTGNTITGGAEGKDILFELRNNTGAVVNATGWVEYALR